MTGDRCGRYLRIASVAVGTAIMAFALTFGARADEEHDRRSEPRASTKASKDLREWLEGAPKSPSQAWIIALGGRVYDNWAALQNKKLPQRIHPLYPPSGQKRRGPTWRCKECHGWDTNGVAGAYRSGSHRTGIKGLRRLRGADPATIADVVRGPTHRYDKTMIPDRLLRALAQFVSRGQIETERYIDYRTARARGDVARGKAFFQNVCAVCHGFDGKALNFRSDKDAEYIGTVARDAPWEVLHKLRNGQPGAAMPAFFTLPPQTLIDIIAYAQTLPAK